MPSKKTARLTRSQKRIIALIEDRPGLSLHHKWGKTNTDHSYYEMFDSNDGLYQSITGTKAVHGLIESGLIPAEVLKRSFIRYKIKSINGDWFDRYEEITRPR